jgi:serine/threonine protein kinase
MINFALHRHEGPLPVSYVGSTIGNYRIESWLGQGGMGEVYLGYDPRLERRVAVKTIHSKERLSPVHKARFLREARLLGKLGHPAICQVYDLIETPESDFLILEYIEGSTLRQLSRRETLSVDRKLDLAAKIADALAVAHREQIVHRDLKADNVMVTPAGEVKVLDFGVARSLSEPAMIRLVGPPPLPGLYPGADEGDEGDDRTLAEFPAGGWNSSGASGSSEDLTRQGVIVGSLLAMSPEQAVGGEITTASDLYSLGILLQELFTGEPAYEASGQAELLGRVARAETRPLTPESGLDRDLIRLLCDLQSLDPRRRPTAEAAAAEFRDLRDKPQRLQRQRLRRRVVGAAFVLLVSGLALVSWFAVEANRARHESERRRRQAEGLIGFMLNDLRPRLERVNRLDLLDAVGDRALAYFGDLHEGELTRLELLRRAQAVRQIGEVRYAQGNLDAALVAFRRATDLARKLVASAPDLREGRDGVTELATAETWIGQVFYDERRTDAALATWRETEKLAEGQLARRAGDPEWLDALASARHNVGTVLELRGDLSGALGKYRESLALRQEVAARKPGDPGSQSGTAATLAYISNILERQGDLAGALAERRAYLAIQEQLAARDPENPDRRSDVAVARGFLAGLLALRGERAAAREQYESGLALFTALAAGDPGNALDQRWLGAFYSSLGALAMSDGDPRGAVAQLEKARALFEPLVRKDPQNPDFRLQLGTSRSRAAAALETLDPARALAEARAAETVLAPLAAGAPEDSTRGLLAHAAVTSGRLEAASGDRAAAQAAWERALALLAPCRRPLTFWRVLSPWAQAELSLDRLEEARPAVERLRGMGFVSRELERLCRVKGLRWLQ